jgi:hypothetical protein
MVSEKKTTKGGDTEKEKWQTKLCPISKHKRARTQNRKENKTLQIATKKRTNDYLVIKTLNPKPMLSNISFMVDATMWEATMNDENCKWVVEIVELKKQSDYQKGAL